MKLKILDAHWWRKEKTDWAIQDKKGSWWIIRHEGKNVITKSKKASCRSRGVPLEYYLLIIVSTILGVSLAFNLYNIL